MSTFFTDFSGNPFLGGKGLRHVKTGTSARVALSWDDPGTGTNVEGLGIFTLTATTSGERFGFLLRGSGSASSETGYAFSIRIGSGLQVQYYDGGSTGSLGDTGSAAPGLRYYLRARLNGTSIRAKFWQVGTPEPESWQFDETDSRISGPGWVGIWAIQNTGADKFCDYFAVDMDGGTAPFPGETPGADQYATDFSAQTTDAAPSDWSTQWATAGSVWTVVDDAVGILPHPFVIQGDVPPAWVTLTRAGYIGGRALNQRASGNNADRWIFRAPHSSADRQVAECIIEVTGTTASVYGGLAVRASGVSESLSGYVLELVATSGLTRRFQLVRVVAGDRTVLWTGSTAWDTGTRYALKIEAEGDQIRVKHWEAASSEPGPWGHTATDANIAAGGVALYAFPSLSNVYFDTFSYEILDADDTIPATLNLQLPPLSLLLEAAVLPTEPTVYIEIPPSDLPEGAVENLHVAIWDTPIPSAIDAAPILTSATGEITAGGVFRVDLTGTGVRVGDWVYVIATDTDGTDADTRAIAAPAQVVQGALIEE